MDQTESAIRQKYSFIDQSISLIPDIYDNCDTYLPISCLMISRLCRAGMVTVDNLTTSSMSVQVQILFNDLYDIFWNGYVSFSELANTSTGTNALTISSESMTLLNTFTNWDEALQPCPFSDIGQTFSTLINGVSP